ADQTRLRALNTEISTLTTRFKHNVLKATADGAVVVDDVRDLDGLSEGQIGAAAQAAAARGLGGKWVIALQNTTNQPLLAQLKNRALRQRVYEASIGRARGGSSDNTAVIAQLVKLRAERAARLTSSSIACSRTGCSTRRTSCTDSPSRSAATCPSTRRTSGCSRSSTPPARRSRCSWPTTSHATTSRVARGWLLT